MAIEVKKVSQFRLTVLPAKTSVILRKEENLLDILRREEIAVESPCSGKGICGKCKVQIVSGKVSVISPEEEAGLSEEERKAKVRLACAVSLLGDTTIRLLQGEETGHRILAGGFVPGFTPQPLTSKMVIDLTKPRLGENRTWLQSLESSSGTLVSKPSVHLLRELALLSRENGRATAVLASGEGGYAADGGREKGYRQVIGLEPGDTGSECFGLAVDIGTTTVVAALADLTVSKELGSESALNPQTKFGLDVLSRIEHARKTDNGLVQLQEAIVGCINELTERLCSRFGVSARNIYEITVAANATMMHLLAGVNPASIGEAPYCTVFSRAQYFKAAELGLKAAPIATVYCLPGVSGYIGADIVAGTVVAELDHTGRNTLFVDIGTNGEMVLSKAGELISCSCAAGPALEGMNISCGMRAAAGAVETVRLKGSEAVLKVIGDTVPNGICGSGIFDAMSEIIREGLVEHTGRLKTREKTGSALLSKDGGKRRVVLREAEADQPEVSLTQGDVRQIQLAKGAILSGICALLEYAGIDYLDLDEVIIAGAFGNHLNVSSLTGLGLIPPAMTEKVRFIGNSSKTGAFLCLVSEEHRRRIEKIAGQIRYFELSTKPGYEQLFTRCLYF